MKKSVACAVAVVVASLTVQAQDPVYSVNAVGYTKVTIPAAGGLTQIGFNYDAVGEQTKTLAEIFGPQTLKTYYGLQFYSDVVYIWVNDGAGSGEYLSYFKTDETTWLQVGGTVHDPATLPVPAGTGMWIQGAVNLNPDPHDIYLHGEVKVTTTSDLVLQRRLNLQANPFATNLDFGDYDWTTIANTTGHGIQAYSDVVYKWNGTSYDTYILNNYSPQGQQWDKKVTGGVIKENPVIGPGQAFWFDANNESVSGIGGGGKPDIIWTIDRSFTYP